MEEDLKILENSIKEVEYNKDMGFFENEEDLKFYNAVEHLVQAYKQQADIIKNSVSKDKIKEILNNKFVVFYEGEADSPDWTTKINKVKYINTIHFQELLKGDE